MRDRCLQKCPTANKTSSCHKYPSANNLFHPSSILQSSDMNFPSRFTWAFWALPGSEFSQRKQRKAKKNLLTSSLCPPLSFLYHFYFYYYYYYCFFSSTSRSGSINISLLHLFHSFFICYFFVYFILSLVPPHFLIL